VAEFVDSTIFWIASNSAGIIKIIIIMELTNSTNVLEALVSNNRSELGKTFGVGMFVSETDTPEQVKAKCKSFVARFETYIANLNVIINSGDELASEMRKARVKRLYSALDENEKEDIKALLN